jgi:hypothetical protein
MKKVKKAAKRLKVAKFAKKKPAEPTIQFNEKDHIYSIGGKIVPSVTQILKELGIINAFNYSEMDALRGKYVHQAIHLHHTKGLNFSKLDKVLRPYVSAYFDFLEETKFKFISGEQIVYNPAYYYAGHYDLLGEYEKSIGIIDVKTGGVPGWAALQTAGYMAAVTTDPKPSRRFALQLTAEGKWTFIEFTKTTDLNTFYCASAVVNWKAGRA